MLSSKVVLAIAALTFLAPSQEATYNLRQKHVEGYVSVFDTDTHLQSEDFDMKLFMKMKYKVLKVATDGAYEEEATVVEGKVAFGGEEEVLPAEDPVIRKYDKDGKEIEENKEDEEGKNPIESLFEVLNGIDPKDPVKPGHKWEVEDENRKSSFEFVGAEKLNDVGVLKIVFSGKLKRTGQSGDVTGTVWLRSADASLEKMELKSENYVPGEGASVGKANLSMKRVE